MDHGTSKATLEYVHQNLERLHHMLDSLNLKPLIQLPLDQGIMARLETILCDCERREREWMPYKPLYQSLPCDENLSKVQGGCHDTNQSEDLNSCELQGKNANPHTLTNLEYCDVASSSQMGVVSDFHRVVVHGSFFCDTLGIVRMHDNQFLFESKQELVDPLVDKINSFRKNDLCPSSATRTCDLSKVSLASDFMYNYMSRDVTANFGYVYTLRQCRLRGAIDSNGCVASFFEERLNMGLSIILSA
ncbi:Mitochondrial import receptor subunit TOM40-1 [Capsicum baccatum]|uniref:Mitochondrial import receptor subunit TOM40-1 n=1 Tax=Capsicum baccatum TaxID=33114 RepID=A0A2G2WGX2_CAPBA|nr:Mitochondrial import receptor subunit TOM40-1 [Capsicum baccatum]